MLFAKIVSLQKDRVTLQLDDEINIEQLKRFTDGNQPTAELLIQDKRLISPDQRKKIFALLADISKHTGYSKIETEAEMKFRFMYEKNHDYFSLSSCSVSLASEFLTFILDFCFKWDIPFRTKIWDSIPSDYHLSVQCLRYRKCVICGQPAEIAHYTAVGNRKRKYTDHRKFSFMSLCHQHHSKQHKIGAKSFVTKYHIKPVKLSEEDLIRLHIMTKKRMNEIDEEKINDSTHS